MTGRGVSGGVPPRAAHCAPPQAPLGRWEPAERRKQRPCWEPIQGLMPRASINGTLPTVCSASAQRCPLAMVLTEVSLSRFPSLQANSIHSLN